MNRPCFFRQLLVENTNRNIVQPVRLPVVGDDVPDGVHGRSKDLVLVVYQTEESFQFVGMRIKDPDLTAADIPFQKPYGYYCKTLVVQDCIAESIRAGRFPGGADVQTVALDKTVKQRPGAASLLPHDEFPAFQILYMDRVAAGKGVVCSASKDEEIPDARNHNQIRMVDLPFYQGDIQLGF